MAKKATVACRIGPALAHELQAEARRQHRTSNVIANRALRTQGLDRDETVVLAGPIVARLRRMARARGLDPKRQARELLEEVVTSWETDVRDAGVRS